MMADGRRKRVQRLSTSYRKCKNQIYSRILPLHRRLPYLRRLPLPAILIIVFLVLVQLIAWAVTGIVLSISHRPVLLGTCALAYSLGLRHALDADHISAIDLMTRRLIATGQRPVSVGTFFSLGHSTIVVITSIVVAATAAKVSERFASVSHVGGIIGTSVSASFLILLGLINGYILWKLYVQLRKVVYMQADQAADEGLDFTGGGCMFSLFKALFKTIDRPWKMYWVGVLFGMGFDTSSEIALLGIASIQGAKGTGIWLILLFPFLFTVGMCLVDTMDGALMMSLYVAPMTMGGALTGLDTDTEKYSLPVQNAEPSIRQPDVHGHPECDPQLPTESLDPRPIPLPLSSDQSRVQLQLRPSVRDPLTFLYYSCILTVLTIVCAIVIGTIQLLTLVANVANVSGPFWDGVNRAGDAFEYIGASICGMFILVGLVSVLLYPRFKKWVDKERVKAAAAQTQSQDVAGLSGGELEERVETLTLDPRPGRREAADDMIENVRIEAGVKNASKMGSQHG